MSPLTPAHRGRPILAGVALVTGLVLATPSSTFGQGASVSVEPPALQAGSTTLTVTGSGFETAGNGVYVVFGPITPAPGYYSDPSIYGAFKWVHVGAGESPVEATLAADGSFSTTLEVTSAFTTPAGDIDCVATACAVITFAAHGSPDRSQDTCVPLVVAGMAPTGSPAPGGSPDAGLPPTHPCAPITGGAAAASGVPAGSAPPSSVASGAP
jgi:hypothetical protein